MKKFPGPSLLFFGSNFWLDRGIVRLLNRGCEQVQSFFSQASPLLVEKSIYTTSSSRKQKNSGPLVF